MFFIFLDQNYKLNPNEYSLLKVKDLSNLKNRLLYLCDMNCDLDALSIYDPIVDSLVQSTLAHFLYAKKENLEIDPDYSRDSETHFFLYGSD